MKKFITLFLLLISLSFLTKSQNWEIIKPYKQWNTGIAWWTPEGFVIGKTQAHKFTADTLINDTLYTKIMESVDEYCMLWKFIGCAREVQGKGFYFRAKNSTEKLFYKYNLSVSDTIQIINLFNLNGLIMDTCRVLSIDSVWVKDKYRHRYTFCNLYEEDLIDTWIEGIGSLDGLLYPLSSHSTGIRSLLCYSEGSEKVYHDTVHWHLNDCFYENYLLFSNDIEINQISLHPNPADDILFFNTYNYNKCQYRIYDIQGRKILEAVIEGNSIDVSNLEPGIYIFNVLLRNQKKEVVKFTKK